MWHIIVYRVYLNFCSLYIIFFKISFNNVYIYLREINCPSDTYDVVFFTNRKAV